MRKIRKLSFFVILGVVICALIFIGISSLQANGIGKKPVKPPEATWAVELPAAGALDTMLYGDGLNNLSATYENNDDDVRIKVEKGSSRLRKGQTAFYYYFSFKLLNPTGRYAGFQNVALIPEGDPEWPYCIFPGGCSAYPTCMGCFLNLHHPVDNYEYFNLKFQVGQHSFTEVLGPIEGIEDMPIGGTAVKFISNSDWIKIRVQNQEDFLDPSIEYHNVECDERNYDDGVYDNMNIWIKRLATNKWRISVEGANLLLQEQYTQRVEGKGKGKKGGTKTVIVVPLEVTGNFSFYIDFIKIPTTQ